MNVAIYHGNKQQNILVEQMKQLLKSTPSLIQKLNKLYTRKKQSFVYANKKNHVTTKKNICGRWDTMKKK